MGSGKKEREHEGQGEVGSSARNGIFVSFAPGENKVELQRSVFDEYC